MTLSDIKADGKRHEPLADAYHAKMDRLSKEGGRPVSPKPSPFLRWNIIATFIIATALIVAGVWFLTRPDLNDVSKTNRPVIDSYAFVNGSNGMRIWINASDTDNLVAKVTVQIFIMKAPGNESYLSPAAFQKVYWVNESSAAVADVLNLSGLLPGDYFISAFATDNAGMNSAPSGFVRFSMR